MDKLFSLLDHLEVTKDVPTLLTFTLTFFIASIALYLFYDGKKNRPPGPWGLPIVGYLPFLDKAGHIAFTKLKQKYGPIIRVQLGSMDCIILGSIEALKESFVKQGEIFSGRPDNISFKIYDNEMSYVFLDGEKWKQMRTFSVITFKELGFERPSLEPVVESEIQFFIKALTDESDNNRSTGFPVGPLLAKSIGSAVCSLFLGYPCADNDPWLHRLMEVSDALHTTYLTDFSYYFPWLRKTPLLSKLTVNRSRIALKQEFWDLWKVKIVESRNAGHTQGVNFLQSWMSEYQKRLEKNDPTAELFSDFSLVGNIDLLFEASFETLSTTLQWAFFFMLQDPETQVKMQQEIDEVIGHERVPQYADAKTMHYTRAFIDETHRRGSIVPLGVFHSNLQETNLMGYHIPKGSIIIPNQYAVHHDPTVFKDPEKFDPSRFLNNGKYEKHESLLSFSLGKRFCPGKFVAEMIIFKYLTSVLQDYTLTAPSGLSFNFVAKNTSIRHPPPFNMCIQLR